MAVLMIFRAKGNSQDLLARYDATLADAIAAAPARPEAHFCAPTGDGIMIVDIWSSRAEVQRAITDNEDFQRTWQDAGLARRDSRAVRSAQHGLAQVINRCCAEADRREVDPTIEVETATWSKAGQLD